MTPLVTANLELLAGAPDGFRQVRALVLELAVRGLLVRPEDGDGDASDLLEEITRTRAGLVAGGALKHKPLPRLVDQHAPFQLPKHWVWTRMGEVTNYGATAKADVIADDAWLLDLEDIERDTSRILRRMTFAERRSLSDKNAFQAGDVLYCKLRPYLNKVIVADQDGYCTTEILPVRCHGNWAPGYFKVVLKSPYFLRYVNEKSYGMKMPRLGTEDGRSAAFPLPPLAEQHRIVAKVDELMALCDRLEARQQDAEAAHAQLVQTLLDSLTQARDADEFQASWERLAGQFSTMFTTEASVDALKQAVLQSACNGRMVTPAAAMAVESDTPLAIKACADEPFELPPDWHWMKLGDLCTLITSGSRGWKEFYAEQGSTFIRSQDIKADRLEFDQRAFVALPANAEGARTQVQQHDLLITITGANVGKAAVLTAPLEDAYVSQHVALVRLRHIAQAHYIHRWLINGQGGRRLLLSSSYGAKPGLNLQNIKDLPIPLPPLAEQHRIVAKVDELLALCDQLKARIAAARAKHAQLAEALVAQAVR